MHRKGAANTRRTPPVRLAALGLALAALLAVTGTAIASTSGPNTQQLTTLTLGTPPVSVSDSLYFGKAKGYFAKQGIDLKLVSVIGQAATAAALSSGAIDLALNTPVPTILASAAGQGQLMISPVTGLPPSGEKLVVPNGSSIKRPRDLAGKKVAVASLNSIQQLAGSALVAADGGDPTTIQWIPVGSPATASTLQGGRADAAMITQPFLQQILATGQFHALVNNYYVGLGSKPPGALVVARTDWVNAHLALAKKFSVAMARSNDYTNKHQAAAKAVLPSFIPTLTPATAQQQVLLPYTNAISLSGLKRMINLMVKFNFIKSAVPVSAVLCSCAKRTR